MCGDDPEPTDRLFETGPPTAVIASRRDPEKDIHHTLSAYALFAYSASMIFVELTPFVTFRSEHWTDEELRGLQNFLLASPEAGDLIRGGSGLRKLRWSAQGRGKRGGARVIYYWHASQHHVYLVYGYLKSEREDLTPQQIHVVAELMKDLKDG